jgi:hypothetical protein
VRRALVVTDEAARHPFLMSLPPHVRRGTQPVPARQPWRINAQDTKEFLMAYCACFLAASAYFY